MLARDVAYFGGKYNFLERIREGGIGSPKIIYKTGIPHFDELDNEIIGEISFSNFELMKNGFLIRVNRNQKLRYVGFQLQEILKIKLIGQKWEKRSSGHMKQSYAFPLQSALHIFTLYDGILSFEASRPFYKKIRNFFEKRIFENKFEKVRMENESGSL